MSFDQRYPMEDDGDTELLKEPSMPNLRWEDVKFQRHVLNALNQMRKSRQFCDVTLRVSIFPFLFWHFFFVCNLKSYYFYFYLVLVL